MTARYGDRTLVPILVLPLHDRVAKFSNASKCLSAKSQQITICGEKCPAYLTTGRLFLLLSLLLHILFSNRGQNGKHTRVLSAIVVIMKGQVWWYCWGYRWRRCDRTVLTLPLIIVTVVPGAVFCLDYSLLLLYLVNIVNCYSHYQTFRFPARDSIMRKLTTTSVSKGTLLIIWLTELGE